MTSQPVAPPGGPTQNQAPPPGFNVSAPPPPTYAEATGQNWKLSYVDFPPGCIGQAGFLSPAQYERFDTLVARANGWLTQNPAVKVRLCESIETRPQPGVAAATDAPTFLEAGSSSNTFIRALRVWIVPKEADEAPNPVQIGCVNVVPACTDPGGIFSMPKFDSFGQTIDKFNQMLRQRPLPGKILNIETQEMKFENWSQGVDPDNCYWWESGKASTFYLYVIRVFYEAGPTAYEEIGCADMVPNQLTPGGVFELAQFEPFVSLVQKAHTWLQQQQGIRVTNVQSLDYKLSSSWTGGVLDTHRSLYRQAGETTTQYVRILRVCYVRLFSSQLPPIPPVQLTYRTFTPAQLTTGGMFQTPQFESLGQTMHRVEAWLQATGVPVLAAETVPVCMYHSIQNGSSEQTYTWYRGNQSKYWLLVLRIYFNGIYQEPPPEALPPPPPVMQSQDTDCCSIL